MPDIEERKDYRLLDADEKLLILPSLSVTYEQTISARRKLLSLLGYLMCNVGLTVYNKAILGKAGCGIFLWLGHVRTTKLMMEERFVLFGLSVLFTVNIAISNVSLAMVSIPFHQVVRATTPLFTILIYRIVYSRTFSGATYVSLFPVILGASIATYGDLSHTRTGFAMTFAGVVLAAMKSILTNRILAGRLALSPLEILYRMSPLACMQSLIVASLQGELNEPLALLKRTLRMLSQSDTSGTTSTTSVRTLILILLGNGILAFILNVSSLNTNKLAGALTMTVCENIKQCLTIVLRAFLFDIVMTWTDMLGIFVTIAGGVAYSLVEPKGK